MVLRVRASLLGHWPDHRFNRSGHPFGIVPETGGRARITIRSGIQQGEIAMNKKLAIVAAAPAALLSAPAMAQATGPDFSALTGAIDFGTTSTAILSVGALAIGVSLTVLGVRKVMSMIRGA